MTPDAMFSLANMLALPGWAILILAPRRWPVLNAVPALLIPLLLSALYTGLVLAHFSGAEGGYGTLADVRQLFASDPVLVAGWAHYLAFDMMIGALLASRMDRAGVQRLVQAPVLIATFMFGPVGMLLALLTEGVLRLTTPQRI
jgi:hypothetical protein